MKKLKRNEKKIITIIISILCVLALFIVVIIIGIKSNTMIINTKDDKEILEKYNKLLANIKTNMNEVSNLNPNFNDIVNWNSYKLNLDSESQIIYDSTIRQIRHCYLSYLNQGGYNSNAILSLINETKISKSKFNKIMNNTHTINSSCFEDINNEFQVFENDLPNTYDIQELKLIIKPIVLDYDRNILSIPKTYNELLKEEYYKVSLLNNISEFLKLKYEKENQ